MMIDVELEEEMEMPCPCECGKWFDLNDGVGHKNRVYCYDCGTALNTIDRLRDDIVDLENDMENGYIKCREAKKKIKGLSAQIVALESSLSSNPPNTHQ